MAIWTVYLNEDVVHKPVTTERNVTAALLSIALDSAGSLELDVPVSHPLYDTIASLPLLGTDVWRVTRDGAEVFRGRTLSRERKPIEGCVSVVAEGDLAMLNDTVCEPYSFSGSPRAYLQRLVSAHNRQSDPWKQFAVGTVSAYDSNDYIVRGNESRATTWEELSSKTFGSSTGGHIVLRRGTHVIDWLDSVDAPSDQPVRLGWNLLDMDDMADGTELVTAIRAVGADVNGRRVELAPSRSGNGVTLRDGVLRNDALVASNGTVVREVVWDDVTTEAALWTKARAYVRALSLPRTVTVKAIDMSDAGYPVGSFDVGQLVTLDALDTSGVMQVTGIEWDMLDPSGGSITFGAAQVTSSTRSAQTSTTANAAMYVAGSTTRPTDAKTAGDSWTMPNYIAVGFLNNAKTLVHTMIQTPYRLIDCAGASITGSYKMRDYDGTYIMGSTETADASLSGRVKGVSVDPNGFITVDIGTGSAQGSSTVANCAVTIQFGSLTITLT